MDKNEQYARRIIGILLIISAVLSRYFIGEISSLKDKIERNKSMTKIALYGSYCNQYQNRALNYFVRHGKWDDFVMFPPVCNLHDAQDVLDALKYRDWKPENTEFIYHSYDSFFTGTGHNGETVDKAHNKHVKEIQKEVDELIDSRELK
jgi:hypothetical protein